jgi:type I restriction enzyme S subunit
VCEFSNGKFIRKEDVKPQGTYPVYGANGRIGYTDKYLIDKSVMIIGRVGSCGEINRSSGSAWITDNTIILAPLNNLDFDFLYFTLKTLNFQEIRAASVQPLITQGDLKAAQIPLPSLPEQKRIASELQAKIEEAGRLTASIEKQLEAINALPQAILKKAFSGEL